MRNPVKQSLINYHKEKMKIGYKTINEEILHNKEKSLNKINEYREHLYVQAYVKHKHKHRKTLKKVVMLPNHTPFKY